MKIWLPLIVCSLVLLTCHGCGSTKPARVVDPELSRTAKAARRAFERDKIDQAAQLYHRALRRARSMDDTAEIANLAYNLGLCLIILENYDEGLEYLAESRLEFSRLGEVPADLNLLTAKVALRQGNISEAEQLVAEGLSGMGESLNDADCVQLILLKTRIALGRNDVPAARKEISDARELMGAIDEPGPELEAEFTGTDGEVAFAANEFERAAATFDRQADLLKENEKYRATALALGRAGEAYIRAGKMKEAAERFYRAARSLFSQGDIERALKMIEGALAAAGESGEDLQQRIVDLFGEIKGSSE